MRMIMGLAPGEAIRAVGEGAAARGDARPGREAAVDGALAHPAWPVGARHLHCDWTVTGETNGDHGDPGEVPGPFVTGEAGGEGARGAGRCDGGRRRCRGAC